MDDSIFDRRHDKRAGLEDLPQTAHLGPNCEYVPGIPPRSRPPKWNPRGELISLKTPGNELLTLDSS